MIELLVVISLIAILSAVVYANFGNVRDGSRNKALMTELKEVQLALELYKAQNGSFPDVPDCGVDNITQGYSEALSTTEDCNTTQYIADLVSDGFIAELPSHTDSSNSSCVISYRVETSHQSWYKLTARNCLGSVNAATGMQPDSGLARCLSDPVCTECDTDYQATANFYESFAVYSFGGECSI